jgi:arabinogalactan endo-1,4-beta-galactosidase
MKYRWYQVAGKLFVLAGLVLAGCRPSGEASPAPEATQPTLPEPTPTPEQVFVPPEEDFYFGVDLSYVNEVDDCGAEYRENGELVDAYELFSAHGANFVRARLWVVPGWTTYSTVPDVIRTFSRAKAVGMATLLDFHYSDNWADPGNQDVPALWADIAEEDLPDTLYQYTYDTLNTLYQQGLMPEYVQVGNETNSGMVKDITSLDWPRDAQLFNAGIQAVRDISAETGLPIKIILHVAQPENAGWWFREATAAGITDFDVIGLSYYPQWSEFSIADVGALTTSLRETFGKDVMIVETAYPWTLDAVDETADNILYQGISGYPISVTGQRQFMIDLTQTLISNGGLGVVYWEPAWVSTPCSTRWGQGSHWENATFFDFMNDNEVTAGIDFLSYDYALPPETVDGVLDESYGSPLVQDEAGDQLDFEHLDLLDLYAKTMEDSLYLGVTVSGSPATDAWGTYAFYFDTTGDEQGANVDVDKHPITVADPYKPEYLLAISPDERKGTVSGHFDFYYGNGAAWETAFFGGGAALSLGKPTTLELEIPMPLLGSPEVLNLAVVSLGRGRVHTAGDILGLPVSPTEWHEEIILDTFYQIDLK